jgi:hypothetical protein
MNTAMNILAPQNLGISRPLSGLPAVEELCSMELLSFFFLPSVSSFYFFLYFTSARF